MTFKFLGTGGIKISLFQKPGNGGDGVSFVATYPDKDIWGENDHYSFENEQKFCFRRNLSRSEWAEEMGYVDHIQAVQDFKDAVSMFNSNDFKHPVTQYFLDLEYKQYLFNWWMHRETLGDSFFRDPQSIPQYHQSHIDIDDIFDDEKVVLETVRKSWPIPQYDPKNPKNNKIVSLTQEERKEVWSNARPLEKIATFLLGGFFLSIVIYVVWVSLSSDDGPTSNCRDTTREIQTITKIDGDVDSVETETIAGCETPNGYFFQAPEW